ncbi:tetratricopeptide repeat protein [Luteimonas sp. BDR2-5]|uniref:tetratricopeptide repeat protein n=1 Tax=Proluteimonas luteida TaxID=2878685 RepID=UPI001E55BC6C|nr:tetratricopeptide repeat protein [Luteimonas sp. BDR2-5]MCD9028114.1 tetratricopeptide repeat protein [Luteimonas sp. BDR2-5]
MQPDGDATAGGGPGRGRYRFGDVVVDVGARTLLRAGQPVALEPKAFVVLLALLERAGELVPKDVLLDLVWGHRHVTSGVLTRAVAQLRGAMDDRGQPPRYIQTRHAIGYMFVGKLLETPSSPTDVPLPDPASAHSADAGDVASAAAGIPLGVTAGTVPSGTAAPAQRVRPAGVRARVALLSLLALLAAVWAWQQRDATAPPRPASIAVLPFVSLGDRPEDGWFAEGLAIEMHDALAGVQGLTVAAYIPGDSAPPERDPRALGRRLGIATVLDASVRREDGKLRINARLSDTGTGYVLWSRSFDRDDSRIFETQRQIAHEVLAALLDVVPAERAALDRRLQPTSSPVAFASYLRGLQALRASPPADPRTEDAIVHFRGALDEDAGFARAQAGICRAELVRYANQRNASFLGQARAACALARDMDAESSEVALALADLHRILGETAQARAHYDRALRDPARAAGAYTGLAQLAAAQGDHPAAAGYFRQALAASPGNAGIHSRLGYQHYLAGDMPSAIAAYRKASELRPDDAGLLSSLAGVYLTTGDLPAAAAALERSLRIAPSAPALGNLAEIHFIEADYARAADLLRRALALDPKNPFLWGNLGNALQAAPATAAQAADAYRHALAISEGYLATRDQDAIALAAHGWYLTRVGRGEEAAGFVTRAEAVGAASGEVALLNAQTLTALGRSDEARQRIADARAAGVTDNRITGNPFLSGISGIAPAAGRGMR